jgi:uncharacterized protein (TIRG00374 family)
MSDGASLQASLTGYSWWVVVPALALALGNYLLRFARWEFFLRRRHLDAGGLGTSLGIFFAGMVMSITPGKVGELLKSFLLFRARQIPVGDSAPIVVMERITDVFAVFLLCVGGFAATQYGLSVVVLGGVVCVLGLLLLLYRPVANWVLGKLERMPFVGRFAPTIHQAYDGLVDLLRPTPLLVGTGIGVVAWGLEGIALYVVLLGFPSMSGGPGLAIFVYAFATLAGAVSFLPGGLVFTEGILFALLFQVFEMVGDAHTATAATAIIRFCTLWFAVALGLVALVGVRRALGIGSTDSILQSVDEEL